MKKKTEEAYPKKGIHLYISDYICSLPDLNGAVVLDIPCGDGRASHEFAKKGATVKAFDLYPEFMKHEEIKAEFADLSDVLPVESDTIDYVICQEGIEHIPTQLKVLEEFNRVLKKDGVLIITTPNYSHVRARLSHFFLESDYWKRMPPTEIDSVWFANDQSNKLYFGHLFLLGVQHFQTLLTLSGFKVVCRIKANIGNTSLIVGSLLYPLFALITLISWSIYRKKNPHISQTDKDRILWERLKLNLSPKTLFCKHLFWILNKESDLDEVIIKLKKMSRI
ncbi:MAG: class I SAM-dependent methyltransferase [Nitrospiria bacterium]